MSTTAKPSPDLLSMPNEVLANICTYATDGDDLRSQWREGKSWLKAVRLTCRQLYNSATTEFADRFLTTLYVMGARVSLETLLKICEHPLIGPRIRNISFYGCRLNRDMLSSLRRGVDSSFRGGDLRDIREARARLQAFLDFLEEEVELEQRAGIWFLLVKALRAIRGYGNPVSLAVFNYPDTDPQMLGYQEVLERVSEDHRGSGIEDVLTRDGIRSSFDTLFSAAARSQCRVEGLSLDVRHSWCETDFPQRRMDNGFCAHSSQVFLNLKALDFTVTADLFINDLDGLLRSFLSLSKNLESLYLACDCDLEDKSTSFGRAIESFQSDCLRHADIGCGICSQADLVSFLGRHKSTLRDLRLSFVTLEGSWEEIMLWIWDQCSLKYLNILQLYAYDKDGHEVLWADREGFSDVLSQLNKLLDDKRGKQTELDIARKLQRDLGSLKKDGPEQSRAGAAGGDGSFRDIKRTSEVQTSSSPYASLPQNPSSTSAASVRLLAADPTNSPSRKAQPLHHLHAPTSSSMSTGSEPHAALLSLPNEILTNICAHSVDTKHSMRGRNWLQAVRLTCKQLYAPATEELAKRFFKSPAVMASRRSLQRLAALCKHDLIGPYIREIIFYPCRLDTKFFGEIQHELGRGTMTRDLVVVAKVKKHIQWYLRRLEDEIRLRDSGDAKAFLERAFSALRAYRKPIKLIATLRMSLDVMSTHQEWGDSQPGMEELRSFLVTAFAPGGGLEFISTIFEAAVAADNQIHTLGTKMDTPRYSLRRIRSSEDTSLSWQSAQAVARLERLQVDLGGSSPEGTIENILVAIVFNAKELKRVVFFSSPRLVMVNLFAANEHEFRSVQGNPRINKLLEWGIEMRGNDKVTAGIDEVLSQLNRQRTDPDYKPSWRSASDMGHLACPED
ncbi:hypothetical protein M436DRAFT_60045 [Aureobasidium namibiae CBS 147.97]|uniref:F-box domain-containing protein n=1 Tax=Aureobasidium namibiae CBS 147.97 TaxID=1043004 RepID=A0A074XU50_9PEZI